MTDKQPDRAAQAAEICESRARSLSRDGDHPAANEARKCAGAIRAALAAPQQAAPAVPYKDGTPHLSVGDSSFESWYESYNPAHKSDKQRARDAYAAGMGDPLVVAAPSGDAESLLRDAREALWQPSNPEICKRIDNFLDAARKEGNTP